MGMFDFLGSAVDWADEALDVVVGGIKDTGTWLKGNPESATLIGSALAAGGSYLESRDKVSADKEAKEADWSREDQLRKENAVPVLAGTTYSVTGGVRDSGILTGGNLTQNGLLANLKPKEV